MKSIGWFSCGAASAVAMKLFNPDIIVYCDTGSEDIDNNRFLSDCEKWLGKKVIIIKSDKYSSTWDVWEKRKYISGVKGAPCTSELKIAPRLKFQEPDDIHVFGYTCDSRDIERANALKEHYPSMHIKLPLIDRGVNKASCLSMIVSAGIDLPRVYAMGFTNANCIPCCKATSPGYWSLIRKEYPMEFSRMTELSRGLGARLARIDGKRVFIDEIPADHATSDPIQPACDMLCQIAEEEIHSRQNHDTEPSGPRQASK